MDCPSCRKALPAESVFCLHCGGRVVADQRLAPVNGSRGTGEARPAVPASARPARQAYALAFQPLADERLRYRVSRWVSEVAPAHRADEIQQSLTRTGFTTFLALTAQEAEAARQRIEALGVHPALVRLAPASPADALAMLSATHAPRAETPARLWPKLVVGALALGFLALLGVLVLRLVGGRPF